MWENRLPMLKADTDVFTTFEGDNTVLLQLVAKGLLTGYRDEFGQMDTLGMVRFATRQFAGAVVERTVAGALVQRLVDAAARRDETDLLDRGEQLRMFEDREAHVLDAQARLLLAARVHIERIVLEAFVAGIDACEDAAAAALLDRVCDLHVLATVERDKAWFLEHGRLTPARAKAVTAQVNRLCAELRPHALTLVEGFGIPHEWLRASIA